MSLITESAKQNHISDLGEISMLENFFQNPEVKSEISHAEHFRKIRYVVLIPTTIIVFTLLIYLGSLGIIQVEAWDSGIYRPSTVYDGFTWWVGWALVVFTIIVAIFRSRIEWALKRTILTKLSKELYSKLEYDESGKYAFGDLDILRSSWFIHSYDSIDTIEDSVGFIVEEWNKYVITQWYELKTSETRWSGKNRRKVTTNHCYLMKIRFPNNRIELQDDLLIKSDEADSPTGSIKYWVIGLIIGVFVGVFVMDIIGTGIIVPILAIVGAIIWYMWRRKHISKNRVTLENTEFEKYFDVVCNDQIGSRMIVTPAFMDRLVKLADKKLYRYELLYKTDCFYIKWNVWSTYLEVNTWKNIETNIGTFVGWYAQMKDILTFVFEMRMTYYSRTLQETIDPKELEFESIPINEASGLAKIWGTLMKAGFIVNILRMFVRR